MMIRRPPARGRYGMQTVNVGLIGCGTISPAYLKAAAAFAQMRFVACADLDPAAALRRGGEFGIPALSVADLLARDDVEVVLNLTIPKAHASVNRAALDAGKHVYCEKPFALDLTEGRAVLARAAHLQLRVGCAPDTFLGGGQQTCRNLIDEGAIGVPVAATAFMMNHGPEHWHPNPAFYYDVGGGPLYDMAPYYITALVNLLGPVRRVSASTGRALQQRPITSRPFAGTNAAVHVATHVAATLDFDSGAIVTLVMSFDVWHHTNKPIEVHGTTGSLSVPDPNTFGGPVGVTSGRARDWTDVALTHGYTTNMRSIGLADMCVAIRTERDLRCSGERALHVLEVMEACDRASRDGSHITIQSRCTRPAPLPLGLHDGELDD